MNNCPSRRGQTVQVGAIVLLGFVVLAITIFQAQGVPQETLEAELEHNQEVADQLETLSVALAETTATGTPQTTELTLGTTHNGRVFFVYPPSTTGTLETTAPEPVVIKNATTTDEYDEFGNYWNLTADESRSYSTRSIQYSIEYRELRETPDYVFEYGVAAAVFDENRTQDRSPSVDGDIDEPVIDDTNISLVVYDGELTERGVTTETVITERVTNATTVELEANESAGPITLNLSTKLGPGPWNETLPSDVDWEHDNESESVNIELDSDQSYNLTVHKVHVGPNATQTEPTYLKLNQDDKITVQNEYNDRVDETVGAWVFADNETSTPEDTLQIPPEGETYDADGLDEPCLTIEKDIENAESYETLDIGESGGCP